MAPASSFKLSLSRMSSARRLEHPASLLLHELLGDRQANLAAMARALESIEGLDVLEGEVAGVSERELGRRSVEAQQQPSGRFEVHHTDGVGAAQRRPDKRSDGGVLRRPWRDATPCAFELFLVEVWLLRRPTEARRTNHNDGLGVEARGDDPGVR